MSPLPRLRLCSPARFLRLGLACLAGLCTIAFASALSPSHAAPTTESNPPASRLLAPSAPVLTPRPVEDSALSAPLLPPDPTSGSTNAPGSALESIMNSPFLDQSEIPVPSTAPAPMPTDPFLLALRKAFISYDQTRYEESLKFLAEADAITPGDLNV